MRRILIILAAALLVASCVRPPSVPSEPSIDVVAFNRIGGLARLPSPWCARDFGG